MPLTLVDPESLAFTMPPPIAPEPIPEMLDQGDMAKLAKVSKPILKRLVKRGLFPRPIIQQGKIWRWSPDQWRMWLLRKEKERR